MDAKIISLNSRHDADLAQIAAMQAALTHGVRSQQAPLITAAATPAPASKDTGPPYMLVLIDGSGFRRPSV